MDNHGREKELSREIIGLKKELGDKLIIPAHHYEKQDVTAISDVIGDSYKLALLASRTDARYILLCGVRFMAESAAILARPEQRVISPDIAAGCPMADMINRSAMDKALDRLVSLTGRQVLPVTYMNSYGDVKALTGERGGAICTSSNAGKILSHYMEQDMPVFFSPDYNLGINTAKKLGIPEEKIFTVRRDGSLVPVPGQEAGADPARGLLFIWDGYCRVHTVFTTDHVAQVRARYPEIRVIVHPECDPSILGASDQAGSTERLYSILQDAPAGSSWAVGTELNFVRRAAADFPDKTIIPLHESLCYNMARIGLEQVHQSLSAITAFEEAREAGRELPGLPGLIRVSDQVKDHGDGALRRMIELTER